MTLRNLTTNTTLKANVCISGESFSILAECIGFAGFVLNVLNILVFSQERLRKRVMNIYLLAKSFSDAVALISQMISGLLKCTDCAVNYSYSFQLFNLIVPKYICYIALLSSIMFEVMATFDRYVIVYQNFNFYHKINYRIIIGFILVYCSTFYVYKFFTLALVSSQDANGRQLYQVEKSEFGKSPGSSVLGAIHSIVRDGICVLLVVILNVLLLVKMKQLLSKKKLIIASLRAAGSKAISNADRAESNITIMVILTGLSAILAHSLELLYFLPIPSIFFITNFDCFVTTKTLVF